MVLYQKGSTVMKHVSFQDVTCYFWYLLCTEMNKLAHILNLRLRTELFVLQGVLGIRNLNKKCCAYNLHWFLMYISFVIC